MKLSEKKGFSFGITSGIITTLGLIVGLHSSTHSKIVIIGAIIIIAIADSLSDASGIHVSEEFENKHTSKEIWESTLFTFLSKFLIALSFIIPILLFSLHTAIIISVIWGLALTGLFSYYMVRKNKKRSLKPVIEHLIIAIVVVIVTHFIGSLVGKLG